MAPPTLFHTPASPVSRGALLAARLLGVEVEVKIINLLTQENMTPEFLKMNPLHTVPTLDDNGFVVVDSHAIAMHLADKYGKNEKLYPKDTNKRTAVNEKLLFSTGVLFRGVKDIATPVLFLGVDTISEHLKQQVHQALEWLEGYLQPTGWVAGDHITIADALCAGSVTSYGVLGFDLNKYSNVKAWIEKCRKTIPDFDGVNEEGVQTLCAIIKSKLKPGQI